MFIKFNGTLSILPMFIVDLEEIMSVKCELYQHYDRRRFIKIKTIENSFMNCALEVANNVLGRIDRSLHK